MPAGQSLFAQLRHRDHAVREAARRRIAERVAALGGDVRAAAGELGISARTVRRWMKAGEAAPEAPTPAAARESAGDLPRSGSAPPPRRKAAVGPADEPVPSAERQAATRPEARELRRPAGDTPAPRPSRAPGRTPRVESPLTDFATRYRRPLGDQADGGEVDARPVAAASPAAPGPAFPPPAPAAPPRAASTPPVNAARPGPPWTAPPRDPDLGPGFEPPAGASGPWPHHQPEAAAPPPEGAGGDGSPRRLAFVLHAHLPWVLGHGTWPHGEDWLAEAVVHCYLPLVAALRRLASAGHRHLLTFSVSPVLAAQLSDRRLRPLVDGYLAHRVEAARRLGREHPLAEWWEGVYDELARAWEGVSGNLLGALAELQATGAIELSTCAATHGYLPLLHRAEHVALQVRAARHNHERWFGAAPAGLWMPECAYRPPGPWEHPVTGAREDFRPGNEGFLAAAGLGWTVVDAHLLLGDEPLLPYPFGGEASGEPAPSPDPGAEAVTASSAVAARLQPHVVDATPIAALFREPHTARQVWSRQGGYPGDPRYLDFHKRHAGSGLRLWRVTDPAGDLGDKLAYHPGDARVAAREHARHFVEMLASVPGLGGGVAVSPYDAELFGHWWFEGPSWLEEVLSRCAEDPRVSCTTPRRELAAAPPRRRAELREGSWGEAGDHRVWANDGTAWMWRDLRAAEEGVAAALAAGLDGPRARAALAQLLLLAASDWPFLVTTGAAADYAAARFRTHRDRLAALLAPPAADRPLPAWADEDLAGLDIDPRWWHWEESG